MLKGYIRFGLLPVASDLQWDKLEKQVCYCSFNETLPVLCALFFFLSFFFFQCSGFGIHPACTAAGSINHLDRIQVRQLICELANENWPVKWLELNGIY